MLEDIRKDIDATDERLVELLVARLELARQTRPLKDGMSTSSMMHMPFPM